MEQTLCNKYKTSCFADIKGQDLAIQKLKIFLKNFPARKAILLHGKPGSGKTSLAYALARETNSEILEINASDIRNKEEISKIIGQASQQASLFNKGKILLIDEVDGVSHTDRGGLQEIISLIETTAFPIIITANHIWDKKFSDLRKSAELIEIKELHYNTIFEIIKNIISQEKIQASDDMLKMIAIKAGGDVRAAINDLQSINQDTKDISERDKEGNVFEIMRQVLQGPPTNDTMKLYDTLNSPLDEIYLWIEENVPTIYHGEELFKAFDMLSKADVMRGRIHRQQHWRFMIYQNFLLSYGVSASKINPKLGFTRYKAPTRILKIWMINQKMQKKKQIAEKYAKFCHVSKKRAMREFPIIKILAQNTKVAQELKLNPEEVLFLNN